MQTQNKLLVYLMVVLIAITFSLPCAWAGEAQKIKLSLAHIYTPKSWNEMYAVPALFDLVEKQTKGKYILDIAYYPSGTLLASPDIFGGVTKGIADIGWSNPGINRGLFPVMGTLSQPGIAPGENAYANSLTYWEFYSKYKPKEFSDVKVLLWCGVGPGFIRVNGKNTEVKIELKETYSSIEECKADILGMYNIIFMIEKGEFPESMEKETWATFLAGIFRSVRFGISEAHGAGNKGRRPHKKRH